MSLLPKLRVKYGEGIGIELFFAFPEISDDQRTFLDADSAASASSFSADGINFSTSQFIVVGQPGNIRTEIAQISSSAAPTSTVITLQATASFGHNRGDILRFIPYDQLVAEYSTDNSTWSTASAVSIRADSTETYMQRSSDPATYYYRFRFKNSSTGLFSAYSDSVIATGYADNTIWSVKNRALTQLGEKRSELITDQFLNDSIQEARRTADQNPAVFRWSFRTKFGQVLGQMLAGQWSISAPTDLRDRNTYKNILSIRIGNQNRPIAYQDRVRFNQNYLNIPHTTLNGAVVFGATSIVLTSSHDFDSSGTFSVAGGSVGSLLSTITYTGNNKTTNTLTGVTGVPAAGFATGLNVWQRGVFGLPTSYTIDAGTIYFDVPLLNAYDAQDAKIDYYSGIPAISTDDQTFDEPFYDLYVPWLKWKIKYLKANGKIDRDSDADYKDWQLGLGQLISQEMPGQRMNFIPDIEGFLSASE